MPYAALVELLVNVLVHRDYTKSSPIRLFIFEHRIEIVSPGNLPDGLTDEQFKSGVSFHRNELRNEFIITIPRNITETALGLDSVNNEDSKDVSKSVKDVSESVKDVSIDINHVSSIIELLDKYTILDNATIILKSVRNKPKGRKELLTEIGVTYQTYNKQRFIDPLIEFKLVKAFNNASLSSPKLKLEITEKGLLLLQVLDNNE